MNYINAKSNTYPFVEVVIYSEIVRRSICAVNQSRFSREKTGDREVGLEEQEKGKDFWHQTRERLGQKRGRIYVLGQRLWQPTHIRGTLRAL